MDPKIIAATVLLLDHIRKRKPKKKSIWIRSLFETRDMNTALLRRMDLDHFHNFTRMSPSDFEKILNLISPIIIKQNTTFRAAISCKQRLEITMRFLATGDSYVSLQYFFKVSKQSISEIVPETCRSINKVMAGYIKLPSCPNEWLKVAQEFERVWNFPLCIGAIDGKHCVLSAPIKSGSQYYNYKGTFSIVLFALVDADYNFMFVDIGCQERISDAGVFNDTILPKKMEENKLRKPQNQFIPEIGEVMPYVILAYEAFALTSTVMKPFAGTYDKGTAERYFNYRLSRGRAVVENVFGILASRFQILKKTMLLEPEKAQIVIQTCTYLHNFLRQSKSLRHCYMPPNSLDRQDADGNVIPGSWRDDAEKATSFLPIPNVPRRASQIAKEIRMYFARYFQETRT